MSHDLVRRGTSRMLVAASLALLPHAALAISVEDVVDSGEFEIFSTALKKAGLWDLLASEDGVTLFLASDKAMRDEGSAFLLEKVLLTQHNEQRLIELVSYHVSFGPPLYPEELRGEVMVSTNHQSCLPVYRRGTAIRVGPEAVVSDVRRVDNGIIYVIDRLLWQPWEDNETCGPIVAKVP